MRCVCDSDLLYGQRGRQLGMDHCTIVNRYARISYLKALKCKLFLSQHLDNLGYDYLSSFGKLSFYVNPDRRCMYPVNNTCVNNGELKSWLLSVLQLKQIK